VNGCDPLVALEDPGLHNLITILAAALILFGDSLVWKAEAAPALTKSYSPIEKVRLARPALTLIGRAFFIRRRLRSALTQSNPTRAPLRLLLATLSRVAPGPQCPCSALL
jgi:hypothetical protein